jgi:hypothetical protein
MKQMQTKQSTKPKLLDQVTVKKLTKIKRKSLIFGTVIAVLLTISPYIFYLYQAFPDEIQWDSPFGLYYSEHYGSVQTMAWVLFQKLIPFLLLLIWFVTCRHWWYHAILVPTCMLAIQMYSVLNDDIKCSDTNELYVLAPIIFFMAIFGYTIRTKIFDKIHGIDLSELSRVSWKGDLQSDDDSSEDEDTNGGPNEDEEDPLYMSQE